MKTWLSNDSLLGRVFGALGDIIIINLLFIATSLPVFSIGASLSAMNYAFLKRRRLSDDSISRLYITGFKTNFKQATKAWLLLLLILLFLIVDLFAFSANGPLTNRSFSVFFWILLALLYFLVLYLFAVICAFENSLRALTLQSFAFAASHIPTTFLLAIIPVCILGLMLSNFVSFTFILSLLILFGFGAIGWLYSFLFIRIFSPYLEPLP